MRHISRLSESITQAQFFMPNVRTQANILRKELDEVFGNRPRLIKAFENLLVDVSTILPGNVDDNADDADSAITRTQSAAQTAQGLALQALGAAQPLSEGPPPVPAPTPDSGDDWMALVMQLLARVSRLESDLANLREGPTP